MKIRKREKVAPIHLAPGDILSVTWKDETGETVLVEDTIASGGFLVIDEALLVDLEQHECDALGLEKAIAGIAGKSK